MKTFSQTIASAMQSLALSDEEILIAQRKLDATGLSLDMLKKFHKEWATDCLFTDGVSPVRPRYPSLPPFNEWLEERLENKYIVPLVKIGAARTKFGASIAMDALLMHWPRTVAWARLFRLNGNDIDACLSHAWLKAAASDPGRYFIRMIETMLISEVDYLIQPDPFAYPVAVNIPHGFRPLCLLCADKEFSIHMKRQGIEKTSAMAESVRTSAAREAMRESGMKMRRKTEECNPHYRITVLSSASETGMVSDELLFAYHALLRESEMGRASDERPAVLLTTMLSKYVGTAPTLSEEDIFIRKNVISNIDLTWISGIPKDWNLMIDGKGGSPPIVQAWTQDIAAGTRRPPLHPMLDYGLWLAERR